MMRRAHINRMQRGRLMWFNLGDEEISGAQTLLRGRKWIWGSRAKPEEGSEGEKSHKLIGLWIFKIKIYLMLLDFVSGTFHCPKLLHGHFQGLGIHNHCPWDPEEIPDGIISNTCWKSMEKKPGGGIQGAWSGLSVCWGCGRRESRDFHLGAILDSFIFHGEFPFSKEFYAILVE